MRSIKKQTHRRRTSEKGPTTDLTHERLQFSKKDIEVGLESLHPPIRQGNATTATTLDGTSNSTISTPEDMKPKKKSKKEKKKRSSYTESIKSATAESNTACEKTEKMEKKRKKTRKKQSLLLSEEEVLDRVVSRRPSYGLEGPSLSKSMF